MLHPKIHCKSKNTSTNNYIPELLMAYSVVDDEVLLEWYEYLRYHRCGTIGMVHQLCSYHSLRL